MTNITSLTDKIFSITSNDQFSECALEVFSFQYNNNPTYKQYADLVLDIPAQEVKNINNIPFLPVGFFKTHNIASFNGEPQAVFTSSSTSGMVPAKHPVKDLKIYENSFLTSFSHFYGDPSEYVFLALLPSYLERKGSSLIYMAEKLIEVSNDKLSDFYLYNYEDLYNTLNSLKTSGKKVILLGVTFALIDFCSKYKLDFPSLIVMETGGMKGRGNEVTREELHKILRDGLGSINIHSEYGMAELLSQAYSLGNGIFTTPHWMKIMIRDLQNPFEYHTSANIKGGINVIDLANIWSCSFIETEDLGMLKEQNASFTVEGRVKNSERRGCNMLIE